MGSFGHFVFFTVKRNFNDRCITVAALFTYFTKWVRFVIFGFWAKNDVIAFFYLDTKGRFLPFCILRSKNFALSNIQASPNPLGSSSENHCLDQTVYHWKSPKTRKNARTSRGFQHDFV